MVRILCCLLILFSLPVSGQVNFRAPLDIPLLLTGNFGELRASHFHTGIDIATNGKEGLNVYSCADGYVRRIRIGPYGYGHAVYIQHPNGLMTVYGHLSKFNKRIAQYALEKQYQKQSFALDIELQPGEIPVTKGEVIAYSGNSGSSGGPHLHFEVRRGDTPLNPMNCGFQISDDQYPQVQDLYIYPQWYGYSGQPPQILPLTRVGNVYKPAGGTVKAFGDRTGFGIYTWDRQNGRNNRNGIYRAILEIDGKTQFEFRMDSLSFAERQYLKAHMDYSELQDKNRKVHRLFRLPGNKLSLYKNAENDGLIPIYPDQHQQVRIYLYDHKGNKTTVEFELQADIEQQPKPMPFVQQLEWNKDNYFYADGCVISLPEMSLFEDLYLDYEAKKGGRFSDYHKIHNPLVPLQRNSVLSIESRNIPAHRTKQAVVMRVDQNGNRTCLGGKFEDGFVKCRTDKFGTFYIDLDSVPPQISTINVADGQYLGKAESMRFSITDDVCGIDSYTAEVDGQWILMQWDPKRNLLYHNFDGRIGPGEHELLLQVSDSQNNTAEKKNPLFQMSNKPLTLKVGDKAPSIKAINQQEEEFDLSDLLGKKVVLYFYPKDNTEGCTKEACSFRDHYSKLRKAGYEIVGVSPDSARKHRNFISKYDLPFPLIADVDRKVIEDYRVWGLKKFMGREFMGVLRTTFVIDENGKIERVIEKVNTREAAQQILRG